MIKNLIAAMAKKDPVPDAARPDTSVTFDKHLETRASETGIPTQTDRPAAPALLAEFVRRACSEAGIDPATPTNVEVVVLVTYAAGIPMHRALKRSPEGCDAPVASYLGDALRPLLEAHAPEVRADRINAATAVFQAKSTHPEAHTALEAIGHTAYGWFTTGDATYLTATADRARAVQAAL